MLSSDEKNQLLTLARNAITAKLQGKEIKTLTDNSKFSEKRGVFVSLHKNGDLRGCIGYIEPICDVWRAVIENAKAAAFEDPRFLPLQENEIDDIKIEISVLTAPKKTKVDSIRPGIDGVVLKSGMKKGTYLPQVWKHFKNKENFLDSLCVKSGLSQNCWQKKDVEVYAYQSETFGE